jgi:hypothetical protein
MTKKRLFLVSALPLAVAISLGVLAMLPPSAGDTKANFDRIQDGMRRAEVETILGQEGEFDDEGAVSDLLAMLPPQLQRLNHFDIIEEATRRAETKKI